MLATRLRERNAPTPATASDWLSPAIYFVTAALPAVASNLEFASSSRIQAVFLYDLDFFGRQQSVLLYDGGPPRFMPGFYLVLTHSESL